MYAVLFQEPIMLLAPTLFYFILFLVSGDSSVPGNRKQDELLSGRVFSMLVITSDISMAAIFRLE